MLERAPSCRATSGWRAYIFFTATGEEFERGQECDHGAPGSSAAAGNYDVFLIYTDDFEQLKDMALTMRRLSPASLAGQAAAPDWCSRPRSTSIGSSCTSYGITFQQLPFEIYETVESARAKMILKEYQKTDAGKRCRTFLDLLVQRNGRRMRPRPCKAGTGRGHTTGYGEAWSKTVPGTGRRHPAAQERPGRAAAHVLPEDSHRRRQDAARHQGDRLW